MKLKNVKVGQIVKVKKSNNYFDVDCLGDTGVVITVEGVDYVGDMTVEVRFEDGCEWGSHKDLKLIEDVD